MKTDISPVGVDLYFIPVETRVPLKFGPETLTSVICARVCMTVADAKGQRAQGWGETPLSVQWVWPSSIGYQERCDAMQALCRNLADTWADFTGHGHPIEVGHRFNETVLPRLLKSANAKRNGKEPMPWLAALVCNSAFDIALHDAYGQLLKRPVYSTYTREFMNDDLAHFIEPAADTKVSFHGMFPADFLVVPPAQRMPAWHLVGGKDLIDASELTGSEPKDGYPVLLADWIERDGLTCLKVKLRGNDATWDYERLVKVGQIGIEHGVLWLTSDFNSTVKEPAYVNEILDRLVLEQPRIYGMMLYVEQPFPYDLEANRIDAHSVSARKPLFMDESAHDWKLIRLGRQLGWTGVALKTCKTQTGAILSLCWAKAHGMTLMVQDLTNPMLAQIPHCLLAAYAGTIMGVETNSMQFYPAASAPEEAVHPGLYRRRNGQVDLSTIQGPGFGYRLEEIKRKLPEKAVSFWK
ncbi:MAG: mandelate racemase/muconate lactonizing enzyme family protein [Sedimentisphaerales bacterium]|nr:mandelate racemase/muconate lactonizing enzyme family protein [Sedimentisphaerales bacterium]